MPLTEWKLGTAVNDLFFSPDPFKVEYNKYSFLSNKFEGGTGMAEGTVVSASSLKKGDVINVAYANETVTRVSKEGGNTFVETEDGQYAYAADNGHPATFKLVKAALVTPRNWPPKFNDVWKSGKGEFFHVNLSGELRCSSFSLAFKADSILKENEGALKLVFRDGLDICNLVS